MTQEEAIAYVEKLLPKKRFNTAQEVVFRYCWQGKSYVEISHISDYDYDYVKAIGWYLWGILSAALGEKVTKANFQKVLQRVSASKSQIISLDLEISPPVSDWGEAVDTKYFYGRDRELKLLEGWIVGEKCRLVTIFSEASLGKTALSVKLARSIQHQFEWVVWRSLKDLLTLDDFLSDLLLSSCSLSNSRLCQLIALLQTKRCLLVLDRFDAVLQASSYRSGYEDYGELIQRLAEVEHQSSIIITTKYKPWQIMATEGKCLPVRSFHLSEIELDTAQKILADKGLTLDLPTVKKLVRYCEGDLVRLKLIGSIVQDFFAGKVAEFWAYQSQKPERSSNLSWQTRWKQKKAN